jgi:hypothetical protein
MRSVVVLLAITQVAGTCLCLSKPINVRSSWQIAFCQQSALCSDFYESRRLAAMSLHHILSGIFLSFKAFTLLLFNDAVTTT